MYLVETYSRQGGTARAKALRWKRIVHVSSRERTGVARAEAERKVWMISSERQLSWPGHFSGFSMDPPPPPGSWQPLKLEQKRQVAGLLWGNWVGDEDRSREADDRITLRDAGYQASRDGCILGRGQHDAGRTRLPATGRIWIRGIQTPGKTWPAPGKEWKC